MRVEVTMTDSPDRLLEVGGTFLREDPVRHNVILTILGLRAARPEPGRYWTAHADGLVRGVALQSPTHFFATVTPMAPEIVTAMVDAIVDRGVDLPGVNGEAATAARFAGHWTERTREAATPVEGQRIYEVADVVKPASTAGRRRKAGTGDRELLIPWIKAFHAESEPSFRGHDVAESVDRRLTAGELWIWETDEPVAMAGVFGATAGVARVRPVYTPVEHRRRGYASALVAELSTDVRSAGHRCILYTDLANPTSNAIYRAIGYRAVDEVLRYDFLRRA
jgi:predicted GNAT family acetyltransferase